MTNRFEPGDIVRHFKRETLGEEELAAGVFLYEIVGAATPTGGRFTGSS